MTDTVLHFNREHPLYLQISDLLENEIRSHYRIGDFLPSATGQPVEYSLARNRAEALQLSIDFEPNGACTDVEHPREP